jgi:hypothetical protein
MSVANLSQPIEQARDGRADGSIVPRRRRDGGRAGRDLWHRVARECDAMAESLFCAGRALPPDLVTLLADVLATFDAPGSLAAPEPRRKKGSPEIAADDRARTIDAATAASLSKAHAALAQLIAPATPEAVLLLVEERRRHSPFYVFGPLPVVRQMLALALVSLLVMLGMGLHPDINQTSMSTPFLVLSGIPLLVIEIYLLAAASLGSCFQNLQQINAYISAGTYDPRFQSTYWTRWVMGVIAGIILAQLIHDLVLVPGGSGGLVSPPPPGAPPGSGALSPAAVSGAAASGASAGGGSSTGASGAAVSGASAIGAPLLALLGGYSVDLVHGILRRIVSALATFFRTPGQDPVMAGPSGTGYDTTRPAALPPPSA